MADETERPEEPRPAHPVAGRLLLLALVVGTALASAWVSWTRLAASPVSVSGIVRVNGKPLPSGVVSFRAVDPERSSYAMGSIDKEGRYVAETPHLGTGILPGEYRVGVLANEDPTKYSREEYDALVGIGKPGIPSLVPKPFTDPATSGLTVRIAAPGPQTYDLNLEGDVPGPKTSDN